MKTAVVLGGYGMIGSACMRALRGGGFRVVGVGRSQAAGRRSDPGAEWLARDIAHASAADWARDLAAADVVVNASGALQDGLRDDLHAIHETAIARLIEGLAGSGALFVQISAAGAGPDASTEFMRGKARGEALLAASDLDWVILRPTLVIGAQAWGGTALLRAAAAFPLIDLQVMPDARIQTVATEDVAGAVLQAAKGAVPARTAADLTSPETRSFAEVARMVRAWQGFAPRRWALRVPGLALRALGLAADAAGLLGWRAPLRSTALRALQDGVTGDTGPWLAAGGAPCRGLDDTLAALPPSMQERWFARLYLLLPAALICLSAFWVASGLIGIVQRDAAQAVLTDRGLPAGFAAVCVLGGGALDLALGLALLARPWARAACLGTAALSLAYMAGAVIWAPDLWADPLGPMVKVAPGVMLSLILAALLEDR